MVFIYKFWNKLLVKGAAAFILFFGLAVYITYPLLFHLGDVVTAHGDELDIAWMQNWVIHVITSGNIFSLFEANLYYPFHHSFAYSDIHVTTSLLSLIPFELLKQPITTVNFTFLTSLLLLGFSLCLLSLYLTKDYLASLLSGILVIFSPAVLDKLGQLQTLAIEWVPLSILFFIIFICTYKTRYLLISLSFFLLQTYNSFLPGYFIVFSYAIIFLYFYFYDKQKLKEVVTKKHIFLLVAAFTLIIPIAIPYYQVSHEFHYTRDIRDTIHFALQPEDFLNAGDTSLLHRILPEIPFIKQTSPIGEVKPGFLGFVFTLLSLYAVLVFFRNFKKNSLFMNIFATIALTGFVLSLGPFLHINRLTIHKPFPIPLPYAILYYLVPGFNGIRDTERWEMLFIIGIAVTIALVLRKLFKDYSVRKRMLIYLLLYLGVIAEFKFPLQFHMIPQTKNFPKVYAWLSTTPKDTKVIFMPVYNWNMFPYTVTEMWREYYATIEFRKMVNGYSGFSPPPWQTFVKYEYKNFPQQAAVAAIKNIHVTYIIVDKKEYDLLYQDKQESVTGAQVIDALQKNPSLTLIKKIGNDYVFAFATVAKK